MENNLGTRGRFYCPPEQLAGATLCLKVPLRQLRCHLSSTGEARDASLKHKKRLEWLVFPVIQPLSVGCFLLWCYYCIGFSKTQDGWLHFVISPIFRYRILGRTYKNGGTARRPFPMGRGDS